VQDIGFWFYGSGSAIMATMRGLMTFTSSPRHSSTAFSDAVHSHT